MGSKSNLLFFRRVVEVVEPVEIETVDLVVAADTSTVIEPLAVRRDRRKLVEKVVVGDVLELLRLHVDAPHIADAVPKSGEIGVLALGADMREEGSVHRDSNALYDFFREHVDDDERAPFLIAAEEHDVIAVRRPGDVPPDERVLAHETDDVLESAGISRSQVLDDGAIRGRQKNDVELALSAVDAHDRDDLFRR